MAMFDYIEDLEKAGCEEIVLIRVINTARFSYIGGFDIEAWIEVEEEESKKKLEKLVKEIEKKGVKAKFVHPIPVGDPVYEIVEHAKKENVSLIMVASRGRSKLKEILLGSVSEGIIRNADRPVLLLRRKDWSKKDPETIFKKIVYAHDLSDHSAKVVEYVKAAAIVGGREVIILHVKENEEDLSPLEEAKNELKKAGINVKILIEEGTPHKVILKVAEKENATMIAMASRGLGFVEGLILGSTTDVVTRRSKIPVLVHK